MIRRQGARLAASALALACASLAHAATVPDWATHNGNARHTGYVPVAPQVSDFQVLWTATLPVASETYNPAATGGGAAYVSDKVWFKTGHLYALELATGQLRWSHDYTSPVYGGIPIMNAPAYKDGMAYVTTGGAEDAALWGYDAATGEQKFRSHVGAQWEVYYSPTPYGDSMYMNGGAYGGAYSFKALSGKQNWFTPLPQYDDWTPAVDANYVYAYTTRLDIINRKTGTIAATIPDPHFGWNGYSVDCAPVLGSRNNVLVTQGNRLISFDLDQRLVAWEAPITTAYEAMNQPSLADGVVYYPNGNTVQMFDEADGHLLGTWVVPKLGTIESTVVVTKNLFFVSTSNGTYAVNRKSPKGSRWHIAAHGQLSMSSDGILVIVSNDNTVTGVKTLAAAQ